MRKLLIAFFVVALAVPTFARSRASAPSSHTHSSSKPRAAAKSTVKAPKSTSRAARKSSAACSACTHDSRGQIKRSGKAKAQFQKSHPCPSTGKPSGACPGYVIDHVQALKHGGSDSPSNMQWQTTAAAKAKDRIE
jgi:hypothetical protein